MKDFDFRKHAKTSLKITGLILGIAIAYGLIVLIIFLLSSIKPIALATILIVIFVIAILYGLVFGIGYLLTRD